MKSANGRKRFLLVLATATRRNRIFGSGEIRRAKNNVVILDDVCDVKVFLLFFGMGDQRWERTGREGYFSCADFSEAGVMRNALRVTLWLVAGCICLIVVQITNTVPQPAPLIAYPRLLSWARAHLLMHFSILCWALVAKYQLSFFFCNYIWITHVIDTLFHAVIK